MSANEYFDPVKHITIDTVSPRCIVVRHNVGNTEVTCRLEGDTWTYTDWKGRRYHPPQNGVESCVQAAFETLHRALFSKEADYDRMLAVRAVCRQISGS